MEESVEDVERRAWLAWSLWALQLLFLAGALPLRLAAHRPFAVSDLSQTVSFVAIATVGAVVASHQPRNPLGWIYLGIGTVMVSGVGVLGDYAFFVRVAHPGLPGLSVAEWVTNWAWVPAFSTLLTFSLLLFPNGHPPSPRWRPVLWASAMLIPLWSITFMFETADYSDALNHHAPNPFAIAGLSGFFNFAKSGAAIVFFVLLACSVASLVVRFRRGDADERHQLKWLIFSAFLVFAWFGLPFSHGNGGWIDAISGLVIAMIPVSAGIAILKYRLYDIDVVISKTVVFGSLAAFITLVYVGIVVGVGALLGDGGDANVGLSILATAVVAVAFQTVRERMTRVANRLVYGKRATPYEVLSEFAGQVGTTYATEDVLPRTARVIAEGTGALRADVWLRVDDQLRRSASWPPEEDGTELVVALPPGATALPPFEDAARAVPVLLQGTLLGALTVMKAPGDALRHTEEALLDDLAGQAGLVLANARLTAELQARLDELTARSAELQISRQRIVIAQDEERRRLERNIHDGAQQHLVALAVKLRLARSLLARDPAKASQMLTELHDEVGDALDTLSNLALGIYPPLLEEQGVAAALAAQYQRTDLPVRLNTDDTGRYPIELEAAVYFCTLEALQNIAKYADAEAIDVTIAEQEGSLTFEVTDDGTGFDPATTPQGSGLNNMRDRLSVLGGYVTVESTPGRGTTIRGRVPLAGAPTPADVGR